MSDALYYDALKHLLRNKFGLDKPSQFDPFERRFVAFRIAEGAPEGAFDLEHLRAIHHHIYQDLFDWAGVLRTSDAGDGDEPSQKAAKIANHIGALHAELSEKKFLADLEPGDFAREAAQLMGELAYVRAFPEGNGRANLLYLKQLAARAGHPLDLTRLPAEPWIEASQAAIGGDIEPMASMLLAALN